MENTCPMSDLSDQGAHAGRKVIPLSKAALSPTGRLPLDVPLDVLHSVQLDVLHNVLHNVPLDVRHNVPLDILH